MKLDDARVALLESEAPWVVVQAFAGAGKTHLAVEVARRFRGKPGLRPGQQILFVSFSTASCSRAVESLRGSEIPRDEVEVCTFHSFALGLVRRYADRLGIAGPVATGSRTPQRGTAVPFDDLVTHAQRLLADDDLGTLVADAYPLVIVDEYQDTTEDLLALLRAAFVGKSAIRCFGDSAQRIQPGAHAFDALAASRADGAEGHDISPIPRACRYQDFSLAHLAKSFRDAQQHRRGFGPVVFDRVGGENEQLAHSIYWPLLDAIKDNRTAAVIGFSNAAVGSVADMLSITTEKRSVRLPFAGLASQDLAAARDDLYLALVRHWNAPDESSVVRVLDALASVSLGGQRDHKHFDSRCRRLRKEWKAGCLPKLPARTGSEEVESVVENLGETVTVLAQETTRIWKSASWAVGGMGALAWPLSQTVPDGLRLAEPGWEERLGRAWDHARRWRSASSRQIAVMTVNQSKNRQFDDVIVYVDGHQNKLRGPITEENRMQMYVAVSRARRAVKIVCVENKKTRRSDLLETVMSSYGT